MRMILVTALVVASVGLVGAQIQQSGDRRSAYRFQIQSTTTALLQADRMEKGASGIQGQSVTLTIGDVVITADDFTMAANGEIRLGGNARVKVPIPGK